MRQTLMLAVVFSISCASFPTTGVGVVQRIPDVIESFDGHLPQAIDTALNYLELAVTKEEQAAGAYLLVAPLVPSTVDAQIKHGFRTVSDLIIRAVELLEKGVTTWTEMRSLLQPIVTAMNGLNDWIRQVPPSATSSWKSMAGELTMMVAKAALAKVLK